MIGLHMGGIPETAMVLGPILLIVAFVRIARRHEAENPDVDDDWDADLGDLPPDVSGARSADRPERRSASTAAAESRAGNRARSH